MVDNRRPLKIRAYHWTVQLAGICVKSGFTPDRISILSIIWAVMGFLVCLPLHSGDDSAFLWLCFAVTIQLRLLCNMTDGIMAIEHNMRSKTGVLFNEVPDRIADILFITGFTLTLPHPGLFLWVGNVASIAAVLTAYIRLLGGSLGLEQNFCGPMAKQHRMALLTLCALIECMLSFAGYSEYGSFIVKGGLMILLLGSLITCGRRLIIIYRKLNAD